MPELVGDPQAADAPDGTDRTTLMDQNANLPAIVPDVAAVARLKSEIDIADRSRLVIFGERAQRSVVEFADRVLAQTQNREIGNTGKLLSDILGNARGPPPARPKGGSF